MTQDRIIEALLAFIAADDATEQAFDGLALDLFAYQFENNLPFRQFSMQRERTPRTTKTWRDIPAVPINAFKDLTLSCCAPTCHRHDNHGCANNCRSSYKHNQNPDPPRKSATTVFVIQTRQHVDLELRR